MILQANALHIPLRDKSVDIVFTSPPYNANLKYATYDDNLPENEFIEFNRHWLDEVYRVMAESARLYVVVSDKLLFILKPMCEEIGFTFGQVLTWCKPNLVGGSARITNDWNYLTEHILLFRKGKRSKMLSSDANTHPYFVIPSPQSNWKKEDRIHPAQFPLQLPKRILSRTPGQVVLDPFMGSGSTIVAAMELGRDAIGLDIDRQYLVDAKRRIRKAQQQLPLGLARRRTSNVEVRLL